MTTGFRPSAVVVEALANVVAHRIASTALVVIAIVVPSLALALSTIHVADIERRHAELAARGASVLAITGTDLQQLPAARCDELASVDGVLAAGAVTGSTVESAVTGSIEVQYVSPGWPTVVWPKVRGNPAVIAGAGIAAELGLVSGAHVTSHLMVDAAAHRSLRDEAADLIVARTVAPGGTTTECLVEAEPGALPGVEAVAVGWFRHEPTVVRRLFEPQTVGATPQQELTARITLWAAPASAAMVAVALVAWWLARRGEFAIYSAAGIGRPRLLLMLATEWCAAVAVPVAIGATVITAVVDPAPGSLAAEALVADLVRIGAIVATVPPLGLAALSRVSAFDALKGR